MILGPPTPFTPEDMAQALSCAGHDVDSLAQAFARYRVHCIAEAQRDWDAAIEVYRARVVSLQKKSH